MQEMAGVGDEPPLVRRDDVAAGALRRAGQGGRVELAVELERRGDQRVLHELDEAVPLQPQGAAEDPPVRLQRAEGGLWNLDRLAAAGHVVGELRRFRPSWTAPPAHQLADRG